MRLPCILIAAYNDRPPSPSKGTWTEYLAATRNNTWIACTKRITFLYGKNLHFMLITCFTCKPLSQTTDLLSKTELKNMNNSISNARIVIELETIGIIHVEQFDKHGF
eukprot:292353_1